jgi:hypothetical protein
METTLSQSGNAKEMQVNETVTFVGRPTSSPGVLFAKGNGVLMATTPEAAATEIAMFKAEAWGDFLLQGFGCKCYSKKGVASTVGAAK